MSVGGVPPSRGGSDVPSPGDDEFELALRRMAATQLSKVAELLEQGIPATEQEWSFQAAMQSLTGSAQRIVAGSVSGREACTLADHVVTVAETPGGATASAVSVGEVRGVVAALFTNRALVDEGTEYAMMNAEVAAQWVLMAGPSPARGSEPTPASLTAEVRALIAQLNQSAEAGSPHEQDVALRRVLANLYAMAATAGHPSQPQDLRAPITALVEKARVLIRDGYDTGLVNSMLQELMPLSLAAGRDPSIGGRIKDSARSLGFDLFDLRHA